MSFDQLGLAEPILRAIREAGYTQPTPIQLQAIPPALAGRDLLGCAQTGTGKTAAFALPIAWLASQDALFNRPFVDAVGLSDTVLGHVNDGIVAGAVVIVLVELVDAAWKVRQADRVVDAA